MRRRVGGVSDGLAHKVVAAVAVMRDSDIQKPPGIAEAIDWLRALDAARRDRARRDDDRAHARLRPQVRRGPGTDPRRWPGEPAVIAELAAAFGRRLHEAGAARHAGALGAVRRRAVADRAGGADAAVLGRARRVRLRPRAGEGVRPRVLRGLRRRDVHLRRAAGRGARARGGRRSAGRAPTPRAARPAAPRRRPGDGESSNDAVSVVPVMASAEERLRGKHFDALEPAELAALYRLMSELEVAAPIRRTRRARSATGAARTSTCAARCAAPCAPAATRSTSRASDRREVRRQDRPAVRHQRLDGAVRPRVPAVPHVRGPGRRGVRVRHPPHADHARAGHALPRARDPARRRGRAGLVVRHAHRRCAEGASTTATAAAGWRAAR